MAGQEFAPAPVHEALTSGTRLTIEKASFNRAARSANCDIFYKKIDVHQYKFLSTFNQVMQRTKWICMPNPKPSSVAAFYPNFPLKSPIHNGKVING